MVKAVKSERQLDDQGRKEGKCAAKGKKIRKKHNGREENRAENSKRTSMIKDYNSRDVSG